ncbi:MAG: HAMP domain-containing histidine kinase [Propionibacteriaceae bacterium]|nr:HAMP domain-containing histidine kinase [Propionibacteriaceae bacterium]
MKRPTRPKDWSLGVRLFVAQSLVLLAAIATAGGVAAILGPTLFHDHLIASGHVPTSPEIPHIEQAYLDSSTASLAVAMVVAIGCALGVTYYVTRRIRRPLEKLSTAAKALSQGSHEPVVIEAGAGPELANLAAAFNDMTTQLAATEQTRLRLLGDLAHELRTPLANIQAHLEAVDDGVAEWDADTRSLLLAETNHLSRLAGDLNDVSRAEEGRVTIEPNVQSLRDVVADVVDAHQPKFDAKDVTLALIAGEDAVVAIDAIRIGQALNNLVNNALRHTSPGGSVTITVQKTQETALVAVADTGDGIAPDQLRHVFDRFYRGDTARTRDAAGSGIGLTIARALVEAHGGQLTAVSPGSGLGSTFTLSLPIRRTPRS